MHFFSKRNVRVNPISAHSGPFRLKINDADKWSLWWARGTTWKWALKVFSDKSLALNKKVNAVITTYNCCSTAALQNSLDLPGCRAVGTDCEGTLAPSDLQLTLYLHNRGTDNNCPSDFQILLRPYRARATRSRYGEQEDVTQTRSGGVKTENNGTIWDFLSTYSTYYKNAPPLYTMIL